MRLTLVLVVLAWLLVGGFVAMHAYCLYDDAFIYFRFVENTVSGCALEWNCGDGRVEGFTSPLWFVALLLLRLASKDLETMSQLLGLIVLASALSWTIVLARRASLPTSTVLPSVLMLLVGVDGYLLLNATIGLEAGAGCLAVIAVFAAAVAERERALIAAMWIAVLVRPELGVFVLASPLIMRRRRDYLVIGAGLLAMAVLRFAIYRDVLPNTFWAKTGGTTAHLHLGAQYLVDIARDFPLVLASPLALRVEGWRRGVRFVLVAAGLQLLFFLYSGGDTFLYSRLFVPFVPVLSLFAIVGAATLVTRTRVLATVLVVALLGWGGLRHAIPSQHSFQNVRQWMTVAHWLKSRNPPQTRIAVVPIGAIGYFSGLPVYDLVGLATPAVAKGSRVPPELLVRSWIGHEKHNTSWILAQKPDLLVFTKWRDTPWTLAEARAGFWAEKQLLDAVRVDGSYDVVDAVVDPNVHWLVLKRVAR